MAVESGQYTPEDTARRIEMARALMQPPKQINHWAEGLNHLFRSYLGGQQLQDIDRTQREGESAANAARLNLLGIGGTPPAPAAAAASPSGGAPMVTPPMGQGVAGALAAAPAAPAGAGDAIAGIESGGRYDATGPVIKSGAYAGDQALGKYQVMGKNVGPWTTEVLGKPMSTQEFLASPEAQEAVFKAKFGQLAQKHGPEGASRAWFAGEGGMNDLGRKDQIGTTVGDYGAKFASAMPGGGASPSGAVPSVAAALNAPAPQAAGAPQNEVMAKVAAMLNSENPYVRRQGAQLADAIVQKKMSEAFTAPKYEFKTAGDTLYRTSERAGTAEPIRDTGRGVRPMSASEREQWKVPEGMSAGVDDNGKPVFSPAGVNVNVGGGSDKQVFDAMDESAKAARQTATGLTGLREARKALEGGAITGAGANERLGLQKVGALLGVNNSDKIENTETFRAAIAPQVAAVLKSTVGTTNISNTDREFAEKAAGGNITLDEKSIKRLLDIMERASTAQLSAHQKRLETVYPDAEKSKRERALFGVDMPAAAVAPEAAPAAGGFKILKVE